MNGAEFNANLSMVSETLFTSGFLKDASRQNFTGAELAQIQIGLSQTAVNAVIAMDKAELERQSLGIQQAKMQNEIELNIAKAKIENMKLLADAIASAIQAESIKRSVTDNAMINKVNAYVSFFNVAMNAIANNSASLESGSTLSSISTLVTQAIESINTSELGSGFDDLLAMLISSAQALDGLVDGARKVQIIAPKTTIMRGEPLTLIGVSLFGDNECEFIDGDITEKTRYYTFSENSECKKEIIFRVKNNDGEWLEDKIYIRVSRFKFKPQKEE